MLLLTTTNFTTLLPNNARGVSSWLAGYTRIKFHVSMFLRLRKN